MRFAKKLITKMKLPGYIEKYRPSRDCQMRIFHVIKLFRLHVQVQACMSLLTKKMKDFLTKMTVIELFSL